MAKRQVKKKKQIRKLYKGQTSRCPNCGEYGPHYVPPSCGEPGMWICKKKEKTDAELS